jgi:hypothetical protein
MARILFVLKPPSSVGAIEIDLESVVAVETVPWISRAFWGAAAFPGLTMAQITLENGKRIRFGGIVTFQCERAMEALRKMYPNLDSFAPPA